MLNRILMALGVAFILPACGGSSDGLSNAGSGPAGTDEGTVTLLVGDGPIDEFDQAVLEVSQILLLATDDSAHPLLEAPATVDLLELENISELLVESAVVPAGTYNKIRLEIDSITLNRTDTNGDVIPGESETVDVPASGRIDLNPRGAFSIAEGDSLELEVDVDLEGAVRRNQDGSLRFRPVVFINRIGDNFRGRNSRTHGVMRELDVAAGTLQLCEVRRLSSDDDQRLDRCVAVTTDEQTLFVNSLAETIVFEALIDGEEATVFGRYQDRSINAAIIAVGERNTFRNLEGEVVNAPDSNGLFEVIVDDLRGVEEDQTISVSLAENSPIFSDDDNEFVPVLGDLQPGVEIEARGVLTEDSTGSLLFRAFFLHIEREDDDDEGEDEDEEVLVLGTVESIDLDNELIVLRDSEQNEFCLLVEDDVDVVRVSSDGQSTQSTEVDLRDIVVGDSLEVAGERDDDEECIEAEDIVILT